MGDCTEVTAIFVKSVKKVENENFIFIKKEINEIVKLNENGIRFDKS